MALEQPLFNIGWMKAAADLSAKQFYCVKVTANATVNIATAAGENILGINQDAPIADSPVNVAVIGVSKLVAGVGDLAAGQNWETAADGTGIAATTGKVGCGTVLIGAVAGKLATVTIIASTGNTLA